MRGLWHEGHGNFVRTETEIMKQEETVGTFNVDLNESQSRLCAWVAEQARIGVTRVFYHEAKKATGFRSDDELTEALRQFRERLDDIHKMALSPIVNAHVPYFEIHDMAHWIWSGYCQASQRRGCPGIQDVVASGCRNGSGGSCDCMPCTV
jgi:hypothetical protein